MYFDKNKGKTIIEQEDLCFTCAHAKGEVKCPLMQALGLGWAHLNGNDSLITNCPSYKKRLTIVT